MDIDRKVSASPQRFRHLFARNRPPQLGERLKDAFEKFGLKVHQIEASAVAAGGYILTASGWHADDMPFAFASAPFTGDPVARALKAAADLVAQHTDKPNVAEQVGFAAVATALTAPVTTKPAAVMPAPSFVQPKPKESKPMAPTPTPTTKQATHKALSFADRLKQVHRKLDADLEDGLSQLEKIEETAAQVKEKVGAIVNQKKADLGALSDVLNQLTNGAPEDEPATQEQAPAGTATDTTGNAAA